MPTSDNTYAPIGEKHIPGYGTDDKRQITGVVASTLQGEILPLQLIFTGKQDKKGALPSLKDLPELKRNLEQEGWKMEQIENH